MSDKVYDIMGRRFQKRKQDDFRRSFVLEIYAVGRTVEAALKELGKTLGWGKVAKISFQEMGVPCEWMVRFTAGGTSMKASGQYVTGGVIVTWWK